MSRRHNCLGMGRSLLPVALAALLAALLTACRGRDTVILATTTSTQDSGLLDVLVPMFEKKTGYRLKVVAVGSGQALAMGRRGDADVILAHSPRDEKQFMAEGHGSDRRLVMHNDFVIVGPADDPAGIAGQDPVQALRRIASRRSLFVSRGDDSGTHRLEMQLWQAAGVAPAGQPWYQESGQGMGATLTIAEQKDAYTICDRATYLALQRSLRLAVLVEGDRRLYNVYHVIQVSPQHHPRVNAEGARAFVEFMVAPETQAVIARFGVDRYGQSLFYADAGRDERELISSP
jgi:tungstate transport system substrate-binding protein